MLKNLDNLLAWPRNNRMPSLLITGEPRIGKTQINAKFYRDHPARFVAERGRPLMPVVSVRVPAATSDRLYWASMLHATGAVFPSRLGTAELMLMVVRLYRDLSVRMLLIDEAHAVWLGARTVSDSYTFALSRMN